MTLTWTSLDHHAPRRLHLRIPAGITASGVVRSHSFPAHLEAMTFATGIANLPSVLSRPLVLIKGPPGWAVVYWLERTR